MSRLQEIFSNREISLLIWLGIFMIFVLTQKSMRNSLADVVKLLFGKYFLAIYLALGLYLFGVFALLKSLGFWTSADIKDSIFWLFSVGFVLGFSLNKAKDSNYFKSIIIDTIKVIAILEFVINFYNFSLLTELILLPILIFIVMLQAVAELDSKNAKVAKLLTNLMTIFGFALLIYSIYKMANGYSDFFKLGTLHSFILPILLTILFLPFLYCLSLYSIYESYFIRLDFMTVKKEKVKKVKRYIRQRANLNINRLNRIMERFDKRVFYDETNLKEYVKLISKKEKASG
ncbi:hypothetical protein [Flavobacterium sp. CS20]|uniref:hypothetical protein n=1 Tax=Flavobacterium sp. CS20 TaxID=2775246 RepID=UPI001B39D452|nr:hypothetical protein [Flavobacterium sp. CS20]QTY27935.1 hypothetical protein IGB25_05380 [Flavobacterium sp. CS20]